MMNIHTFFRDNGTLYSMQFSLLSTRYEQAFCAILGVETLQRRERNQNKNCEMLIIRTDFMSHFAINRYFVKSFYTPAYQACLYSRIMANKA